MANLNSIKAGTLGIDTNVVQAEDRLWKEVTDGTRSPFSIPYITSVQNRTNVWQYNWSAGESWTNYHNYLTGAGSSADSERAFWFALGTNTRQNTLSYSGTDPYNQGSLRWAKNSVAGGERTTNTISNNTSYGPMRFNVMFLRNHHPSLTKSRTMWGHYSNYWSAGYEGSGVAIGTPNVNNSYSTVSDVSWSVPVNRSSGNSAYTWSWNVSIPPRTTVAVVQANSMYYWTSSGGYRWFDINKFYNLDSTFGDSWIQPDMKMTFAAWTYNDRNNEFNSRNSYRVWRRTAELFGERP